MTDSLDLAAIRVQLEAIVQAWTAEHTERLRLARSMATDGNRSYQEGYADGLDRALQAVKMIADTFA